MRVPIGIFLITLSGLMFEVGLTRIFSATIWYHFSFVAISVALLGWSLGGFALELARKRLPWTLDTAALTSLLYAGAIPVCLWIIVQSPFRPERLPVYFGASLVPFFLAGMTLSLVFALRRETAGTLYFADLLGASAGALSVTLLLSWLGGETAVVGVSVLPAVASALLSGRYRTVALACALAVVGILSIPAGRELFFIKGAPGKGMYQHLAADPSSRVALTGWNAYSRIDAVEGCRPPCLARLYIDSDAWTGVLRWDGDDKNLAPLRSWYRALPFKLVETPRTLVIGPGGGSDVMVALASGSPKVTAVELNPLMLRFVRHYGERAGHLYDQPRVETILSEGRNFISRTSEKYDVILLGFVDSWAAVASGGLSLSENYLYTTEAFREFYDHLTEDGMLVILRWSTDIPRLVSNSVALLSASEARSRIVIVKERRATPEEPPQVIFMLRKRPFTPEETLSIAQDWSLAEPVILPGRQVEEPYSSLLSGTLSLDDYARRATRRVDPVFDDSPFYFATHKPLGIPRLMSLAFLGLFLFVFALLGFFVVWGRWRGGPSPLYGSSIAYFCGLGLGFITVELALLQLLTLLLGHPIFTLSVLLFTLLAAGGIGSYRSGRASMTRVSLAVAGLAALYALVLPRLVSLFLPLPIAARIGVAVGLVAPLGFAMGMPFPLGLKRTGERGLPAAPFYWGLNGATSVVGSMATVVIAVTLGFRAAMLTGAACYVVAALAARRFGTTVNG